MPQRILIGNIISLSSSVFLFWGSITARRERVYLFGIFECTLLFIAQLFFGQGAAAVSLLIAAFRNFLLWLGKYTRSFSALIFILTLILGLLFNTGGALGLLPLIATLTLTVTSYYAKTYVKLKLSLFLNLSLWSIFSILIFDVSSSVINLTSAFLTVVSLLKYRKDEKSKA